jgi:CDP-diacylglycerol---glycerol-3-phosphate 3-phosphatidyltransferase
MRVATQPEAGGSTTWGELINQRARGIADTAARWLAFTGVTPNMLTVIGFLLTVGVAGVIASGYEQLGGVLVILVGLFDMLDGAVARVRGMKTRFGAFLDSTLDRYSEAVVLGGVLVVYPELQTALLILAALAGSLLVSYSRAKAEGKDIGVHGEVGWLPRPQRIVLLSAGLITGLVVPALWVLAVFTNVTTIQRILHVRRQLEGR